MCIRVRLWWLCILIWTWDFETDSYFSGISRPDFTVFLLPNIWRPIKLVHTKNNVSIPKANSYRRLMLDSYWWQIYFAAGGKALPTAGKLCRCVHTDVIFAFVVVLDKCFAAAIWPLRLPLGHTESRQMNGGIYLTTWGHSWRTPCICRLYW